MRWDAATMKAGSARVARVGTSLLFAYSGVVKLWDVEGFASAVAGYALLPGAWVAPMALFVPWLELWCALALWWARPIRPAAYLLITGMLVVFTFAKASVMVRGLDVTCGCTGGDEPMTWGSVAENGLWLAFSVTGWCWDRRWRK